VNIAPVEANDDEVATLVATLARAGCVAAIDEAAELLAASADEGQLRELVKRRVKGEPLAWVVGHTRFCGLDVAVEAGVFVPRWQSETLAREASGYLHGDGIAIDLATGSGAVALALSHDHPRATVVATELDARAVACARRNGVEVYQGHLFDPLPPAIAGRVDVVVGVLPYVPSAMLASLPRDARDHEPAASLDGGADGLALVRIAVAQAPAWLRIGGLLALEVGQDQVDDVLDRLSASGFRECRPILDHDGDRRGALGFLSGWDGDRGRSAAS
jgi:release factor glutamine methyltransferase